MTARTEKAKAQSQAPPTEEVITEPIEDSESGRLVRAWTATTAWMSRQSRKARRWFGKHRKMVFAVALTAFLLLFTVLGGWAMLASFGPVVTAVNIGAMSQVITMLAVIGAIFVIAKADPDDSVLGEVKSDVEDALAEAQLQTAGG